MHNVAVGALVGAALGACAGFASHMVRQRGGHTDELGYDWPHVKADQLLTETLRSVRTFSHADERAYWEIGQACDNIVSLYGLVRNPEIEPMHHWCFKSFQYRRHVEDKLRDLALAVKNVRPAIVEELCATSSRSSAPHLRRRHEARRGHGGQLRQPQRPRERNTNLEEYGRHADSLCFIVQNYHNNIINEMRFRPSGAVPPPSGSVAPPTPIPTPNPTPTPTPTHTPTVGATAAAGSSSVAAIAAPWPAQPAMASGPASNGAAPVGG